MESGRQVRRILVVGDGGDAALVAAVLARSTAANGTEIVCLRPEGEHLQPRLQQLDPGFSELHALLAFSEADFMRNCDGTFCLGINILQRSRAVDFVLAEAAYGAPFGQVAYHSSHVRADLGPDLPAFDRLCLAAQLGRQGKFCHPGSFPPALEGGFRYGYHVDRVRYRDYLFRAAAHYGARLEPVQTARFVRPGGSGPVEAVETPGGHRMTADLYIDASGEADREQRLPNLAEGGALDLSWQCADPRPSSLAHAEFSDERIAIGASAQSFSQLLLIGDGASEVPAGAQCRQVLFAADPWTDNHVSIGASAFGVSPLAAGPSRLLGAGLRELLSLLPATPDMSPERREYNRRMRVHHDRVAELHGLLGWLAKEAGQRRLEDLSSGNRRRVEQFLARGRIVTYDSDPFGSDGFAAIFVGSGLRPRSVSLAAQATPASEVRAGIDRLSAAIEQTATSVSSLPDYIERMKAGVGAAVARKEMP